MTSPPVSGLASSDVTIRLQSVEELFTAPAGGFLARSSPRLLSGIDELLNELGPRRLNALRTVTIVLPAGEIEAGLEQRLKEAVGRYCELRSRETDNDLRAMQRDGLGALLLGTIMLAGGLALAALVAGSSAPSAIRTFFGEGVFLIIAWVGAWYPLDVLIHYMRPYRRTKKLLEAVGQMDVVLQPSQTSHASG